MKPSTASKTILGVTCLLCILGFAGSLTLEQRERQIQSRVTLLHTYEVISALEGLELALNEAETGQRGFVLTGNPRYLAPFTTGSKKLEASLKQIKLLTKDNSDQQQSVGAISTLVREKFREMEETIVLRRSQGLEAALKVIKSDSGQRFMEEMRTRIEEMKTTEQSLLDTRTQKLDAITKRGWSTLVQLLLLTMVTIAVAAAVLYRTFMAAKRSKSDVEEKKQMLQIMLDTMSDAVIIADTQGNFVVFNPAAEEMFGKLISIDPQQWSAHFGIFESDCVTAVPPENLPLARAMRGESVDDMEIFVRSTDRPQGRWVLINARPIDSPSYRFKGGMVVCRDVSERKEAEKRVSEFYSTVSHELRTPLTSIRASLGLIEGGIGGEVSEKARKLVIIARHASDRLIRLINDILDISKIEAGKFELNKKKVEIETLVQKTLDGIAGMAQEKSVAITKVLKTSGPLDCDEDRIIQVITNLLSNAIKFSDPDSKVVLRLEPGSPGFFKFSIIDQGPGIPKEQMHKLFGKFQQLDSSDSRKNEGTGLGLVISKALVESHGGKIPY
jgi:signal transduction histidine kinase